MVSNCLVSRRESDFREEVQNIRCCEMKSDSSNCASWARPEAPSIEVGGERPEAAVQRYSVGNVCQNKLILPNDMNCGGGWY